MDQDFNRTPRPETTTHRQQRLIGLTGGIATGKTTVADYLEAKYALPILDADRYAREAVRPGTVGLRRIIERYTLAVLHEDGTLNRTRLGNIIFHDPRERQWLEALIHPYVRQRMYADSLALPDAPGVVLAIPLLFEAAMTDLVTETWVVTCAADLQIERLITRDRLTPIQARARIASQMPLTQKVARADVVLDNNTTREVLEQQVDRAWLHSF